MEDSFLLTERYSWNLTVINDMDWSDFQAFVGGAKNMYEREKKAAEAAAKGR
jgi:hypothetical protein